MPSRAERFSCALSLLPRNQPVRPRPAMAGWATPGRARHVLAPVTGAALGAALCGCQLYEQTGYRAEPKVEIPVALAPEVAPSDSSAVQPPGFRAAGDELDLSQEHAGRWPEAPEVPEALVSSATGAPIDPERALAAIAHSLPVYSQPSFRSRKLGFLRIGAVLPRSAEAVGHDQCEAGWYRIEPEGYVCVGRAATLDLEHPLVTASRRRPDRSAPLPYVYGMSRKPTPPFYVKVPSLDEQKRYEQELHWHLPRVDREVWSFVEFEPIPTLLQDGRRSPTVRRLKYTKPTVTLGRAEGKSGFAMLSFFEAGGRQWGLNAELEILPLDRLTPVEPSAFQGLELDDEVTLPVVFVHTRHAHLYSGTPSRGLSRVRRLQFREALPITGRVARLSGAKYYETRDGSWVKDERLIRVDRFRKEPGWVKPGRTWLDISILKQSLVAYEGTKPVYATLVSTGIDGIGDPEETHSTIRGQFLTHTKHVTITMSGDEVGDEFDLRDVPYVQYFKDGYALHAAYWHDSFGQPRSHGCINLSPLDARWLFDWTDPQVPPGWHGALSLTNGTLVHIHP